MRFRLLLTLCLLGCGSQKSTIPDPSLDGPKTWYGVIGPLVATRCGICHRPGDIAPFPLETYAQVKPQAAAMRAAVAAKTMPPFPPEQTEESGCPRLDDVRRMSDAERDVLLAWLDDGLPEGEFRELPEVPKNEPLGPPNNQWDMDEEYNSTADTPDDYRCFVVDPHVVTNIPVAAVSVLPGNRRVVHHSAVYLIPPDSALKVKQMDADEPGPGYTCYGGAGVEEAYPTGLWVPGNDAPVVPPSGGVGYYLLPGWVFVVQQHYNYAAGKQPDRSSVVLWRADVVISEVPHEIVTGTMDITIPPNTMNFSITSTASIVNDPKVIPWNTGHQGRMYTVWGHMHTLGKSLRMDLVRKDGTKQCLLNIPKWDFSWQSIYRLRDFVDAKEGDQIVTTCTWDNTRSTEVTYGENTANEMCFGAIAMLNLAKEQ